MTASTAALVGYKLIPVVDPRGNYDLRGALWAEPDVEDAAAWLRRLAEDRELRERLGATGRDYAQGAIGAGPLLAALAANGIAASAGGGIAASAAGGIA